MINQILQVCNLGCAITNQMVLYIAILVIPLGILLALTRIFAELHLQGVIMLIVYYFIMTALSLFHLVPWYISVLFCALATYTQFSGQIGKKS